MLTNFEKSINNDNFSFTEQDSISPCKYFVVFIYFLLIFGYTEKNYFIGLQDRIE